MWKVDDNGEKGRKIKMKERRDHYLTQWQSWHKEMYGQLFNLFCSYIRWNRYCTIVAVLHNFSEGAGMKNNSQTALLGLMNQMLINHGCPGLRFTFMPSSHNHILPSSKGRDWVRFADMAFCRCTCSVVYQQWCTLCGEREWCTLPLPRHYVHAQVSLEREHTVSSGTMEHSSTIGHHMELTVSWIRILM